ncbi:MAG: ATP-binding protein [Candidatus Zixiibacteriota bacterium]
MRHFVSFSSLRFRAMVAISGLIILTSAVLGAFLFNHLRSEMKQEVLKRGETTIRQIASSCEYGVLTENRVELHRILEALTLQDDFAYAVVQDSTGEILAQFDRIEAAELVTWIANKDFRTHHNADSIVVHYREVPELQMDLVEFCSPVRTTTFDISLEDLGATAVDESEYGSKREMIGMVRIGLTLERMYGRIYDVAKMIVVIIFFVTLAVIGLTALMVNVIIKPIDRLVDATEKIAKGELTHLQIIGSMDEICRLAKSFNVMVESLRDSRDEIEMYNRTLELKIAERTKELEEAQTQLVQSEKMSAVGQLSAGIAHELNNPMGGILGYAQFALEKLSNLKAGDVSDKDIESQRRYLSDIEQQARRCRLIIKNLLKFSRSTDKTEWEPFELNTTLIDTISLIQHQLDLGNIELVKTFADDLPELYGNTSQLQQVFTNLLLNAQHAMLEGGQIHLTTRLAPQLGEFSGCIEVIIKDNGAGIAPGHINKIFEPFFTTKATGQGTGLGLSISYGIIKDHGGDITVSSELGKGTEFTVILPLESSSSAPKDKSDESDMGKIRAMISE